MGKFVSLVGERFERLEVIEIVDRNKYGIIYKCKCDCGEEVEVVASRLRAGKMKSCGCYRRDRMIVDNPASKNAKYPTGNKGKVDKKRSGGTETRIQQGARGESYTRLYGIFSGMKKRCYNTNSQFYKNYGGRGIEICDEWLSDYQNFKKWAWENGYSDELSIERVNVNGNYEPSNCTWIDMRLQAKNRTNVAAIEYNGKTYTIRDLAKEVGIKEHTLAARLRAGWSVEEAVSAPVDFANAYKLGRGNEIDEKGRFKKKK